MRTFYAERDYLRNISAFASRSLFCAPTLEIHNSVIFAGRKYYTLELRDWEGSLRAPCYHSLALPPITLVLCQTAKIAHTCLEIKDVLQVI